MGAQKVKDKGNQKSKKSVNKDSKDDVNVKEITIKKWKGKDWFTVLAPKMFNTIEIAQVPATDPQHVIGRNIIVSLSDITKNPSKYRTKLRFKVKSLDENVASTEFNGLTTVKEQLFRIVRKRTSKVEIVHDFKTKDDWVLHLKVLAILNKSTDSDVQKKIRANVISFIENFASKANNEDFVKTVCDGIVQKNIKKFASKLYPIRFCEVAKIEVVKTGQ